MEYKTEEIIFNAIKNLERFCLNNNLEIPNIKLHRLEPIKYYGNMITIFGSYKHNNIYVDVDCIYNYCIKYKTSFSKYFTDTLFHEFGHFLHLNYKQFSEMDLIIEDRYNLFKELATADFNYTRNTNEYVHIYCNKDNKFRLQRMRTPFKLLIINDYVNHYENFATEFTRSVFESSFYKPYFKKMGLNFG